jgi:hypothetical protein
MIMTQDKALKSAIRARMAETGEPYNVARRAVLTEAGHSEAGNPDPGHVGGAEEDYYERYLREAADAGVPIVAAQARIAADRAQAAAEQAQVAADLAQELADEAEEKAGQAEERAELAEESASMAQDWADPQEQERARQRADEISAQADRAREQADRAQETADHAQERADMAAEAAELAGEDEDEDGRPGPGRRSWGGSPPPRPPRPPRPVSPDRLIRGLGAPDRIADRVEDLMGRFDEFRRRTDEAIDRISREFTGRRDPD